MTRFSCFFLSVAFPSFFLVQAPPIEPDKTYANGIGMRFEWISPGTFMMGSPMEEEGRRGGGFETQHKVTLTKGFYMGVHLVTQEQWKRVMGNNPSVFQGAKDLPVDHVSWDDCQEFIKKLRSMENKPYRLPFEAEWEYACRAGTTTAFYCGETISTDEANFDGNATYGNGKKGINRKATTPVGSFVANRWGLYDMHGNLLQWCQDFGGEYQKGESIDPTGPKVGDFHVYRGGSWFHAPTLCRSAWRSGHYSNVRNHAFGFRVCFWRE